jgi:AraC-like DNA-binding protein
MASFLHSTHNTRMERLHTRQPGPALAPFIETLWYYHVDRESSRPEMVLPHGEFELVISLEGPAAESVLSGPQTGPMIVDPGSTGPILGAHFRPGGAAAILGYSASAFRDRDVSLADIGVARARDLHERVQGMRDPNVALRQLERLLTRHAINARALHPAIAAAADVFQRPRPPLIRDLVEESGLSQRRFIELFTDQIGLTPKLYARIRRFQQTVEHAARTRAIDWAALAMDAGYSDQAHLIREFRSFSGMSPGEYAPRQDVHPNHVPAP